MKEEVREVIVEKKVGFSTTEVIIVVFITLIFGAFLGSFFAFKKNNVKRQTLGGEFDEFITTYNNITNNYYEKVDSEKLINSAIKGMIEYLDDPYTVYMDNEESEAFNEVVGGEYYGIGAVISKVEDKIIISAIIKNSPAEKAGLKTKDEILSIDDKEIKNMNPSDVTNLIKNQKTMDVSIKVRRESEEKTIKVLKGIIDIPSVSSKVFDKNNKKIGYVALSIFASNTYDQFKEELEKIEKESIDALIIDVRSNPGGHLKEVSKILSTFITKEKVLYQIKSKGVATKVYSSNTDNKDYKIAVIVNENSASASEILAASLRESRDALVVGKNTYGKGTVQKAYSLKSGATIKYTSEEWLTPLGNSINKKGLKPDIEVDLDKKYFDDPKDDNDTQLQKALDEITK